MELMSEFFVLGELRLQLLDLREDLRKDLGVSREAEVGRDAGRFDSFMSASVTRHATARAAG